MQMKLFGVQRTSFGQVRADLIKVELKSRTVRKKATLKGAMLRTCKDTPGLNFNQFPNFPAHHVYQCSVIFQSNRKSTDSMARARE